MVLVTVVTADGEESSVLLQNAETVRLVGPAPACSSGGGSSGDPEADAYVWQEGGCQRSSSGGGRTWRAISVSHLQPGDEVLLLRQGAARHTGIAIDEAITER